MGGVLHLWFGGEGHGFDAELGDQLLQALGLVQRLLDLSDPAAGLNLGNLLRDQKHNLEAEAAYRWAVKADPHFASAWHNLADLLDEGGRLSEAVDCEKRALDAANPFGGAIRHGNVAGTRPGPGQPEERAV